VETNTAQLHDELHSARTSVLSWDSVNSSILLQTHFFGLVLMSTLYLLITKMLTITKKTIRALFCCFLNWPIFYRVIL